MVLTSQIVHNINKIMLKWKKLLWLLLLFILGAISIPSLKLANLELWP